MSAIDNTSTFTYTFNQGFTVDELEDEYDAIVRSETEEDLKSYADNEVILFDDCECP